MTAPRSGNGHMLSEEEFAVHVSERIAATGDIVVLERAGLSLVIKVGETNLRLHLGHFYTAYTQAPQGLDAIAETVISSVRNFNYNRGITSFDQLKGRIFPMLKPLLLLAEIREQQMPMLVYRLFLANLIIAYVIDEPQSVAFINEEHLEHWQISEQTLHEQAIANLHQRTMEQVDYTMAGEGAQRIFVFNSQDGYDATRLLLTDLLEQWRQQIAGRMVIGIPNRDFLIAFSDADRQILANVARQIQIDAQQQAYGLTDRLFTYVNGEVREYEWE